MIKKNLFKKLAVLTMVGIMSLSVVACGDEDRKERTTEATTEATTEEKTTAEAETEEVTEEVTEEETEEKTEEKTETNTESGSMGVGDGTISAGNADFSTDDWKSLEFSLDGNVISFPITYAEVKALGFSIDSESENETLEANHYTTSIPAENAAGEEIYIRFKNFTDGDKLIKDCDIYGFGIEEVGYRDVNPTFTLCNGISFGVSVEDIKAVMGEPDYLYESDDKTRYSLEYYVTGKSYENTIKFSVKDGELNSVTIENVD